MSIPNRAVEKVRLLRKIERQRGELSQAGFDWLDATEKADHYWVKLVEMRKYLVVGSSLLAVYGIRHPSAVIRWSRRAFGIWGTVKLFRKTIGNK
ncbi:YqjK-like family protein [Rahnella aquatilis]|uniref:YqjK-like family protein n=1 Tax=Rahnella aquatilis TaxID=34038 RepID=UPI000648AFD0|nr:YqjK-like family protein [Rahnella aquatilis]